MHSKKGGLDIGQTITYLLDRLFGIQAHRHDHATSCPRVYEV